MVFKEQILVCLVERFTCNCSVSTGKDKSLKELENDIAALETRIRNLDTGVTTTYTDDNIHGDTPTPTRQLSIVSQTHEGVSESCSQLLKKLDIVQIGFVQIQSQNKQMVKLVHVVNSHVLMLIYPFGDSIVHFVENLSISILEMLEFFLLSIVFLSEVAAVLS